MKAVVLEIRKGMAAVLREDGAVVKIKKKRYRVGDTIIVDVQRKSRGLQIMRAASAAAAVLVAVSIGGVYHYTTIQACSYVSLDINPSIEYTLNWQNKVLSVEAVNEDGEKIVELLKGEVKNKALLDALQVTTQILSEQNVLSEEEDYVLVNVASESDERKAYLTEIAEEFFEDEEDMTLVMTEATMEERETARDLGISTGKYKEIEAIEVRNGRSEKPDQDTIDSYRDKPVREFMHMAGQLEDEPKVDPPEAPGGSADPDTPGKADGYTMRDAAEEPGTNAPQGVPDSADQNRSESMQEGISVPGSDQYGGQSQETPSGPLQEMPSDGPEGSAPQPPGFMGGEPQTDHPNP